MFKILISLILLITWFLFFSESYAATVDVWNDINLVTPVSNDLNLSWTTSWFELCDFIDYMWTEESNTLFIEMPYEKDMAMIYANDINNNPWTYNIKLTATCNWWDPSNWWFVKSDTFILTISAPTPNQEPTDITINKDNIDENNNTWASIWDFSTVDPDDPGQVDTYKYSLVSWTWDDDNDNFHIEDRTLHIDLQADYETKSSYKIRVQTQDSSYASYEKEFIININDVDETVPSVDAWIDQNIKIWDTVTLNGTKSWFPENWCNFSYNWSGDNDLITIVNSWSLNGASFDTNNFTWDTTVKVWLTMNVTSTEITHDSCWKTWTYTDDLKVAISKVQTHHHRKSYSSKMRDEADYIFRDKKTIGNIHLILSERNYYNDDSIYDIWWNTIGWYWQIKYEVEYSTWINFKNHKTFKTTMDHKMFFQHNLDPIKDIYFFRVRAFYKDKYSLWSNILNITNKQNPLKIFKIKCNNCKKNVWYMDVFDSVDLLIEKNFNVKCNSCKKKIWFNDVWESKELLLDKLNIKCSGCKKKIDLNDSLNYNNQKNLNVPYRPPIKKIDFSNLIR